MSLDKKVQTGQLRLVLLRQLGEAVVTADCDLGHYARHWRHFVEFDDDRFFSGASRGDYLDALTAHAGLGSVVALEGDSGSVSTLLGQAVMALLGDMEIVRIDGAAEHNANVVIESLLRHFDIDRAALTDKLRETLADGRILGGGRQRGIQLKTRSLPCWPSSKSWAPAWVMCSGDCGTVEKLKGADFVVDDVLDLPALAADDIQDFAWFVLGMELEADEADRLRHDSDGNIARLLGALRSQDEGAPMMMSASREEEAGVGVGAAFVLSPADEASMRFAARQEEDVEDEDDTKSLMTGTGRGAGSSRRGLRHGVMVAVGWPARCGGDRLVGFLGSDDGEVPRAIS